MAMMNVKLSGEGKHTIFKADSFLMNEKNLKESVFFLIRCQLKRTYPRNHPAWRNHRELVRRKRKEEEVVLAKERRLDILSRKLNGGCCDEKTWWSLAKDIYRPRDDKSSVPLERDGVTVHDPQRKANMFNEYFCSMNTVIGPEDPIPEEMIQDQAAPGLDSLHFQENQVLKVLSSLKTASATGYDGISNIALRQTAGAIAPYLTELFNCCMFQGVMPQCWKKANVTPVFKKGSPSKIENYRPISLLSCASKVLERLVADQLRDYLESNQLLTNHQYGFCKGSSTVDQLLDLYEITEGLDKRLVTKLLFLDVSKAFDRVWHKALIHKL